jgi:nicotinamidase/pyrazinamidase
MRDATQALLVIDVQNDFCPGGALAVPGGDEIVPGINALMAEFSAVILTQDWHPADHLSFASQHPRQGPDGDDRDALRAPGSLARPLRARAALVREFHADLDTTRADLIIRKGFRRNIDSYSAFFENDQTTPTGLEGYLKTRGISKLTLVGLATDFCVNFSAVDAARLGFEVEMRGDLTRAIDLDGSLAAAQRARYCFNSPGALLFAVLFASAPIAGRAETTCAIAPGYGTDDTARIRAIHAFIFPKNTHAGGVAAAEGSRRGLEVAAPPASPNVGSLEDRVLPQVDRGLASDHPGVVLRQRVVPELRRCLGIVAFLLRPRPASTPSRNSGPSARIPPGRPIWR